MINDKYNDTKEYPPIKPVINLLILVDSRILIY